MTALPMTGFHRVQISLHGKQYFRNTATLGSLPRYLLTAEAASFRVRDSHPIPLFSWNKNACPFDTAGTACAASVSVWVAHLPQKPVIDSFFIFVFTFPCETTKKTAVSQAVRIHHIHLVLYMAVSTCLTSISRKVPPSELPATVTGISFLPAYLFASMYASAPEKFLHPSDNSSPVSSFKRITVACQSEILTPLPLVTLINCILSFAGIGYVHMLPLGIQKSKGILRNISTGFLAS